MLQNDQLFYMQNKFITVFFLKNIELEEIESKEKNFYDILNDAINSISEISTSNTIDSINFSTFFGFFGESGTQSDNIKNFSKAC